MVDSFDIHNNKNRVLLTEVLPYEVVLGFDSEQFFNNMNDSKLKKLIENSEYVPTSVKDNFKIPFDYHIRRSGGSKSRKLSLMHPVSQLECVDFYEDNKEFLLYYTSLSPFSLRHPYSVAKVISKHVVSIPFVVEENGEVIHQEDTEAEKENLNGNYFNYKKYDLSYKFFESFEFFNLEKKYSMMRHLDVASCFYHIYTHSICWAVKDKKTAKQIHNSKNIFENRFDKLMSDSNYGETNGIIVGPEISRIFAEIIFQRMDLQILDKVKLRFENLTYGRDFEIRRYVDDYYVFANSLQILDNLQDILSDVMEEFKLFLNKAKIEDIFRPMATPSQTAKYDIRKTLNSRIFDWQKNEYIIENLTKSTFDLINEIRLTISKSQASYGDINANALGHICAFLSNDVFDFFKKNPQKMNSNILLLLTELSFYLFSMDWHPTVSFKLCRIISILKQICGDKADFQAVLRQKIITESKKILDIMEMQSLKECTNIEMMNILMTLKIEFSHNFSEKKLYRYFHLKENDSNNQLDYFQICVLLFLCGNDPAFGNLKKTIQNVIDQKFERASTEEIKNDAEMTYLVLDLMTCPYLEDSYKNSFLMKMGWTSTKSGAKRIELAKPGQWYFKWNFQNEFIYHLKKKGYRPAYE